MKHRDANIISMEVSGLFYLLLSILILVFLSQVNSVMYSAGNWDEYHYLSSVYELKDGVLKSSLQTIHARLFSWLVRVSENEADQILWARMCMLIVHAGTCAAIYSVCRSFVPPLPSILAVLFYSTFSYSLVHGASFRPDPMATFLLMFALVVLIKSDSFKIGIVASALACAIAASITIKSVIYAPVIIVVLLMKDRPFTSNLKRLLYFSLLVIFLFISIIYLHGNGVVAQVSASDLAVNSLQKTVGFAAGLPRLLTFADSIISNLHFWVVGVIGIVYFVKILWKEKYNKSFFRLLTAFSFVSPVAAFFFYRNSFPYVYPFLLAPFSLIVSFGWLKMLGSTRKVFWVATFQIMVLSNIVFYGFIYPHKGVTRLDQRELIKEVHNLFPAGTPYIDRSSMISSFPKFGFFMSTWGRDNYLESGKPIFDKILREKQPKFILANAIFLYVSDEYKSMRDMSKFSFFEADLVLLEQNYLHHWGPIFIAGKRINNVDARHEYEVDIIIPGMYTLETDLAEVNIDGLEYENNSTVELKEGAHLVQTHKNTDSVVLRYGDNLPVPDWRYEHILPFKSLNP